jgi:hypothetical protein
MTNSDLQNVVEAVISTVFNVGGISQAPTYPAEKLETFPFVVVYVDRGIWQFGANPLKTGLHNVAVELHINRKDLPIDTAKAMVFSDSVPNALLKNPTLNGKCSTFGRISYQFGLLNWGESQTMGFRWVIEDIKCESAIT